MDTSVIIPLATIGVLTLFAAFFSAAETGLTAISRARIYHLVMEGNRRAILVSRLRREKESLIGAVLLGNNGVNVAASAIATSLAIRLWGQEGVVYVTIIMTALILIFAEVMPKTYAMIYAERVALGTAPILAFVVKLLTPITGTVKLIVRGLFRLFGIDSTQTNSFASATDMLRGAIELHHREGEMIKQDRDMLGSILDLNDITVSDVMAHRTTMQTVDAGLPAAKIIHEVIHSDHSRIPLWQGEPDNIVGVLLVKKLIRAMNERPLDNKAILELASPPWFVPDTTNLRDQLLAFRQRREHIALVVDEYGALLGIVTLEDILEEIVGEIDDEHDNQESSDIIRQDDGEYLIGGTVTIRDLNRQLDWSLPDEDASTVAGLLIHEARDIPEIGGQFEFHGYRFTVEDKQANQLTRLRVAKLPEAAEPAEDMLE